MWQWLMAQKYSPGTVFKYIVFNWNSIQISYSPGTVFRYIVLSLNSPNTVLRKIENIVIQNNRKTVHSLNNLNTVSSKNNQNTVLVLL